MTTGSTELFIEFLRRNIRLFVAILFLVFQLYYVAPTFSAASPPMIRMGYPQPSGAMLPIWVMSDAKIDHKYGVDFQIIYISVGDWLTQPLIVDYFYMYSSDG